MAIADIKKKILSDARANAKLSFLAAEEEIRKIADANALKTSTWRTERINEIEKILSENERRAENTALGEMKMRQNMAKRKVLEDVFKETLAQAAVIFNKEFEKHFSNFVEATRFNDGILRLAPNQESLAKSILSRAGFSWKIVPDQTLSNGFIFSSSDTEYNFTVEKIFESIKGDLEINIARDLFK